MDVWKWNHNVVLHETEKRNPIPEHYMREAQLFISVSSQSIIVTWYLLVHGYYKVSVKQSIGLVCY